MLLDLPRVDLLALRQTASQIKPSVCLERYEGCRIRNRKAVDHVVLLTYQVVVGVVEQDRRETVVVGRDDDGHDLAGFQVEASGRAAEQFDFRRIIWAAWLGKSVELRSARRPLANAISAVGYEPAHLADESLVERFGQQDDVEILGRPKWQPLAPEPVIAGGSADQDERALK